MQRLVPNNRRSLVCRWEYTIGLLLICINKEIDKWIFVYQR